MNEFDDNDIFSGKSSEGSSKPVEKVNNVDENDNVAINDSSKPNGDPAMPQNGQSINNEPIPHDYDRRPQYPYNYYTNTNTPNKNEGQSEPTSPYGNQQPGSYGNQPYNRGAYPQNNPYTYSNRQANNNGYAYQQNNAPAPEKKNGRVVFIVIAFILLLGVIVGLIFALAGNMSFKVNNNDADVEEPSADVSLNVDEFASNATPDAEATTSARGALSSREIFEKVKESSVGILVYDSSKSLASEGTGVIMEEDNDGKYTYIVTCAHVISDKNVSIMVQLFNGKEYTAQVIGFDAKTDIGVLRIEENGLSVAEFGDSGKLNVGDTVYAIGNPGGTEFANSFTNGMISAIDRPVSSSATGYTMECIQHTAAINPGNSGGALVNEFGQVIGINSMKIIADEYEGMGFSVPSSVFIGIVNEIIANGYVSNRPKLGITYVAASEQQSYAMYVAIKGLPAGSIIIYSISDDSDLANTDVQKGDMITAVNGKGLDDTSYLSEVIESSKVGDTLTLSIVRINSDYTAKEFEVKVKLVEDRGDTMPEEESTTSSFYDDFFNDGSNGGGNGGNGSDEYEDFFNDFFGRYFNP